jgi:hypothetical protein
VQGEGPRRRVEDAEVAVREAVVEQRLDPEAGTRWLLGLSIVERDRQARLGDEPPRRRATDP